jgi:hypothetical protein
VKSSPLKPPQSAPKRGRQTLKELQELQKLTASVIMQPLARGFKSRSIFTDGRPNEVVAAGFIKANDRLTPFERIAIYNKQYWYRLIDILYDDYPGLAAILGRLKFNRLVTEYLQQHPSRSFTLRDLGHGIAAFITEHPELVPKRQFQLCVEIATFEWAQVLAFDEPGPPPISLDDLLGKDPANLKLGVQPYISLLHLHWPLDDFTMQLKRSSLRGEASNAVDAPPSASAQKKIELPAREEIFIAVHRLNNDLYYKRLDRNAYSILTSLKSEKTLADAVDVAVEQSGDDAAWTGQIQAWFANWAEMGWLCKPK